jgi:microcystin-dependent protein
MHQTSNAWKTDERDGGQVVTEVYVGQIMMTGFEFAPRNFAQCNGQILSINQNQALFALLGVQYGGNGSTTFQLPNLQGSALYGAGASVDPSWQPTPLPAGAIGGSETVTLTVPNLPIHTHALNATGVAGSPLRTATNALLGKAGHAVYGPSAGTVPLAPNTLAPAGGGLAHDNMQPFLVINFNIALSGIFPSRN